MLTGFARIVLDLGPCRFDSKVTDDHRRIEQITEYEVADEIGKHKWMERKDDVVNFEIVRLVVNLIYCC